MSSDATTADSMQGRWTREVERFSNHSQRHVRLTEKYREALQRASNWAGSAAPLAETPDDPAVALAAIDHFARVHREPRAALFGAYFAHQSLLMQARMARDLLRQSLHPDPAHRIRACAETYRRSERLRRAWVAALLDLSLSEAAPDLHPQDFVALNVGALTDHEDVDLAIIVRDADAKPALVRGFAQVAKIFLRFASKIQLFLTEELPDGGAGATVPEVAQLLRQPNRNVVSTMQLLGAQYLCGNRELERKLHEEVTQRYYAGMGEPLIHEGFLRGVRQELKLLLRHRPVPGILAPKKEIYYPAKLAIAAARVMRNVTEPVPPQALEELIEKDPERSGVYQTLSDAFVQIEVLRALIFLYVFQGDELDLSDPAELLAVRRVAVLFGLSESARRRPEERLIGAYMDLRGRALQSVWSIAREIDNRLERINTFRHMMEEGIEVEGENLVVSLAEALERHRGGVFWDEVVQLIRRSPERSARFIDDFKALPNDQQVEVASRYVAMMAEDAPALVEFLTYLATAEPDASDAVTVFWDALIAHLASHTVALIPFVARLDTETRTEALFRLSTTVRPRQLSTLADLIERRDPTARSARVVRSLRSLVFLVHHRSNAVGRIANRVMARTPHFVRFIGDQKRLRELAERIVNAAAREPDPETQNELLGDSFDVAMLRASLVVMLGAAPETRDSELTAAVDRYVRELFKACFREVRQRSPLFQLYRPGSGIAVFATGGYGRGEMFGGDFDYIAVVRGHDPGLKKFFGKVLQRVSSSMSRRGLHPHNRFTGQFNAWVIPLPDLAQYLTVRNPETFIDEAEVLEARFLLGDPTVARSFNETVVPIVADRHRVPFITDLIGEIRGRRSSVSYDLNLKEAIGGLRELQLTFLALRCHCGAKGPMSERQVGLVERSLPGIEADLRFLLDAHRRLRTARELYRLTVAFDDRVEPEQLEEVAYDLLPMREAGVCTPFRPYLVDLMARTADRIDAVLGRLEDAALAPS